MGVMTIRAAVHNPARAGVENYHRRTRDPMAYPTNATMPIAREYQVATNSGLSSVQWDA